MAAPRTPSDELAGAVDSVGSQSELARLLNVSQQAVSAWLRDKKPLPPKHVLTVEKATGISRHRLRPDLYPREAPAAPPPATGAGDLEPAR